MLPTFEKLSLNLGSLILSENNPSPLYYQHSAEISLQAVLFSDQVTSALVKGFSSTYWKQSKFLTYKLLLL